MGKMKNIYFLLLTACTLLLSLGACTHQKTVSSTMRQAAADHYLPINSNTFDHRKYGIVTLRNGLEVALISDPKTTSSAATLLVDVGSYQDPLQQQGLAHYVEHMLFLGTKKYPVIGEFTSFIENSGGAYSGTTFAEKTRYHFNIPNHNYEEALDRFADFFISPLFDETYSKKELNAIDNEWTLRSQLDPVIFHRLLGLVINPEHPKSKFSAGNKQTLKDKPGSKLHKEMLAFYKKYYSANNMKLVLYGPSELDQLKQQAKTYFSELPNRNTPKPRVKVPAFTKSTRARHLHFRTQKNTQELALIFPIADNIDSWESKTNEYVSELLAQNQKGSLVHELGKQSLVNHTHVDINSRSFGNSGAITISFRLSEQGLERKNDIINAFFAYIAFLKKDGLSPGLYYELKKIRNEAFDRQHTQSMIDRMNQIAFNLFDYPKQHALDFATVFTSFNKETVSNFLAQISPKNMLVVHFSPDEPADTDIQHYPGSYSLKPISDTEIQYWLSSKQSWNYQPRQSNPWIRDGEQPKYERKYSQPAKVLNKNWGDAVLIHDENTESTLGISQLRLETDIGLKSAKHYVMGCLLNDLFTQTSGSIRGLAKDAGTRVSIGRTARNSQSIGLSGPSIYHRDMFEALLTTFRDIIIDQSSLDNARQNFLDWQTNIHNATPIERAMYIVQRELLEKFWRTAELVAAAKEVQLADLINYHQQYLKRHYLRLFAAGNYDEHSVDAQINSARHILRKHASHDSYTANYKSVSQPTHSSYSLPSTHNDNAYIRARVTKDQTLKKTAHLQLLNIYLNSELFQQLRTEENLAYIVDSKVLRFGPQVALLMRIQSNNTSLDTIAARFDRFEADFIKHLLALPEAEFNQLKNSAVTEHSKKEEALHKIVASEFKDWENNNYHFDSKAKFLIALKESSKQSLIETYRSIILDSNAHPIEVKISGEISR